MRNEIVLPDYNHCILNTITSILKYYNVETTHNSLKNLDNILEKKYKKIVLLILDGMGEHILNNISPNGFFSNNHIDCITSVYPSTTTAAMTTYYSGRPPYETGWIAWSQYFKEYGRTLDMLPQKESYLGESIKNAMVNVFETTVGYKTIYEKIEEASPNVKAYEICPKHCEKKSKRSMRADNIDEVIDSILELVDSQDEKFILAYLDNPDSLLHKFGTDSEEVKDFIKEAEEKIQKMSEKLDEYTLLMISADHGHKNISKYFKLYEYLDILECLIMPPSLESRVLSFWVKEDKKQQFEDIFNDKFGDEFWLMSKEEFLQRNMLGYGEKHPKIDDFIGNYIALSTGESAIKIETLLIEGKKEKKSTHCGLSKEEMEVPLIVISKK